LRGGGGNEIKRKIWEGGKGRSNSKLLLQRVDIHMENESMFKHKLKNTVINPSGAAGI
jgi:hypothetical protein